MSFVAIINPVSGAGADAEAARRRTAMIDAAAARRGVRVDVRLTERAGHATLLAREAIERGCESIIVWGGVTGYRWPVVVGSTLALPVFYTISPSMLVGVLPFAREALGRWLDQRFPETRSA